MKIKETQTENGKNEKKTVRYYAAKGLVWLLLVMLFFTVVSRITASFTVAQVSIEYPSSKKIEHVVTAYGTVEKNRELAVLTEPDILVASVYVNEGQKVEEGEVLAELNLLHLAERIDALEDELQILRLTSQATAEGQEKSAQSRQTALNRAQEDYEQTVSDWEGKAAKAAEELQSAWDAYFSYKSANAGETVPEEVYQQLLVLQDAVKAKQDAYDAALENQREAVKNAERALEDAGAEPAADNSVAIMQIQISQKEQELARLEELEAAEGKITAPVEGVVTEVCVRTGQKTTDTAAVTLADLSSGMRYVAQIGKEDAKYVSVGDDVTLDKSGREISGLSIDTLETEEDGGIKVTVLFTDDALSIGDSAALKLQKESQRSGTVVPLTALHQENGKNYVYILDVQETVLGEQYFIRRVDVQVKDKNSQYAALEEETLTSDSLVVVDSDRYIEAGSRVRLWEP